MFGSKLLYYGIILPISFLPYFVLYRISEITFVILYYGVGYRKKVVKGNINIVFPGYSEKEKKKIEKQFYLHFCDLIVESVKNLSVSRKQIKKRIQFGDVSCIESLYKERKNVLIMSAHYGNWELFALGISSGTSHEQHALYKPLKNAFFEKVFKDTRGKFGLNLLSIKQTPSFFADTKTKPIALNFISDQWPSHPKRAYWVKFFNLEVPFLYEAEKIAKKYELAVVYGNVTRTKRGYYEINFELISSKPKETNPGEITQLYANKVQHTIERNPAFWLWSHKRFKKNKKEVFD